MGISKKIKGELRRYIKKKFEPAALPASSLTTEAAATLLQRYSLIGDFLPYRDFDAKSQLVFLDAADGPAAMFGIEFQPFTFAGKDAEESVEEIIKKAPVDTVLQFGQWCSTDIDTELDNWAASRSNTDDPLMIRLALERAAHFKACLMDKSLAPSQEIHPRRSHFYLFVRVPFQGDVNRTDELQAFARIVGEYRDSTFGAFRSMHLAPEMLDEGGWSRVLRQMLHPQIPSPELDNRAAQATKPFPASLHEKQTRTRPRRVGGGVEFDSGEDTKKITVVPLTFDHYPRELRMWEMGNRTGDPLAQVSRIAAPFWLYTTIHVPNADETEERVKVAYGWVTKQCMSESAWFRQMVPHLYERRDATQAYLSTLREGHIPCRIYSGINLYISSSNVDSDVQQALKTIDGNDFKVSQETHIAIPAFIASLPGCYSPEFDKPSQGLRRASLVSSVNAASAAIVQGDWKGNSPWFNARANAVNFSGIPLVSRRGELGIFDVFHSDTAYNFFIAAKSGSGKSVLANEIVAEILARGGIARIVDAGGSYEKINKVFGGEVIKFDAKNPMSMNPYWGLSDTRGSGEDEIEDKYGAENVHANEHAPAQTEIGDQLPLLRDITVAMAYPTTMPDDFERAAIQDAIMRAYRKVKGKMGAADVYHELDASPDQRVKDIALQIREYAVGTLAPWFNGEPQITFRNRFTILELEELNSNPDLRGIVMQLVIKFIERDMFRSPKEIPKLCLIDEAWQILQDPGGQQSGASGSSRQFIEAVFRKIRKHFGTAGVIVQSLRDAKASAAAMAAFENSQWKIVMLQDGAALKTAADENMIPSDDMDFNLISSVRSGTGYSEMAIVSDDGVKIARFFLDPFSYFCYTSDANDNKRIFDLADQGMSLEEALGLLAEERKHSH